MHPIFHIFRISVIQISLLYCTFVNLHVFNLAIFSKHFYRTLHLNARISQIELKSKEGAEGDLENSLWRKLFPQALNDSPLPLPFSLPSSLPQRAIFVKTVYQFSCQSCLLCVGKLEHIKLGDFKTSKILTTHSFLLS